LSTKIYTAYRVPVCDFSDTFLPAVRGYVFRTVAAQVKQLAAAMKVKHVRAVSKGMRKPDGVRDWEKHKRVRAALMLAAESAASPQRSLISDVGCVLNVWCHSNRMYVIPICEPWVLDRFPYWVSGAEDYCYWDNADKHHQVSDAGWESRKRAWEKVCLNDHNATRMVHTIVDLKPPYYPGLREVVKLVFPREDPYLLSVGPR
jgi:hypothetical protein